MNKRILAWRQIAVIFAAVMAVCLLPAAAALAAPAGTLTISQTMGGDISARYTTNGGTSYTDIISGSTVIPDGAMVELTFAPWYNYTFDHATLATTNSGGLSSNTEITSSPHTFTAGSGSAYTVSGAAWMLQSAPIGTPTVTVNVTGQGSYTLKTSTGQTVISGTAVAQGTQLTLTFTPVHVSYTFTSGTRYFDNNGVASTEDITASPYSFTVTGTTVITLGFASTLVSGVKAYYFGIYSGTVVPWYQIGTGSNTRFLLSVFSFGSSKFDDSSSAYSDSTLRGAMNGLYGSYMLSGAERRAVAKTALPDVSVTDAGFFPLSDGEWSDTSNREQLRFAKRSSDASGVRRSWWFRSSRAANSALYMADTGYYDIGLVTVNYDVRPAFHLDLSSVLFESAAAGGKSSGALGAGALHPYAAYTGDEWKLTLMDNAQGSGREDFAVATASVSAATAGGDVSISYSGAKTGTNEYLSAMLVNGSNEVLYYGRLNQLTAGEASGAQTVTVPALSAGTYTLRFFNEQYNGAYKTDYASAFQDVTLTVTDGPVTPHTTHSMSCDCATDTGTQLTFTQFPGTLTNNTLPAGSYYLADDVTLTDTLKISGVVNLCLNGHKLTAAANKRVIQLDAGVALNLCDCRQGVTGVSNTVTCAGSGANGTVSCGVITGGDSRTQTGTNHGGGVLINGAGAAFNMYGGAVSGNTGNGTGGVRVSNGAFTMYGGEISYNCAAGASAGGVIVSTGMTFNMQGGTIKNNSAANGHGGGIFINGGTVNMSGGTITGNTIVAGQHGGGVYVGGSGAFHISGSPTVSGNTRGGDVNNVELASGRVVNITSALASGASLGITAETPPTAGNPVAITGANGNSAYASYLISDSASFETYDDGTTDKTVKLRVIPAAALTGTVGITGTLKYDSALTAALTGGNNTGTLHYQWKRGSATGTDIGTDSSKYTLVAADIGQTIYCVITSSVQTGSRSGSTTALIGKADGPAAPSGLTGTPPTTDGGTDGKITGLLSAKLYEYTTTPSTPTSWIAVSANATEITGLTANTYYVRIQGTTTHEPGSNATVTVLSGAVTQLSTPTSLTWGSGATAGTASWNAVTNASSYLVQLYKGGTAAANKVTTSDISVSTTSYDLASVIAANGTGTYYFKVKAVGNGTTYSDSDWTTSGGYDYTAPPASASPAITDLTQDKTVTVVIGSTATLSVQAQNATGYQWYVDRGDGNGWQPVRGANAASYTTSAVTMANDGYRYYCVITGAGGTANSPIFTLHVIEQPDIPATGDSAMPGLWAGLMPLAGMGLAASVVLGRRKRHSN